MGDGLEMTSSAVTSNAIEVDGQLTKYYAAGRVSAPPVLLLHDGAWGADGYLAWQGIIGTLARGYWVLAPDLLGFGGTAKTVVFSGTPHAFRIRHLAEFCRAVGLTAAPHVVGTSYGGTLALRAVISGMFPMASVTSIGGTGGPWRLDSAKRLLGDFEPGRDYIARVVSLLTNSASGLSDHVDRRYANSLDPDHYAAMVAPRLKHPAAARRAIIDDYPRGLQDVAVPIALVSMRHDQTVERDWPHRIIAHAPKVAHYEIDGPHSPNISEPQSVTWLLRKILASNSCRIQPKSEIGCAESAQPPLSVSHPKEVGHG